MKITILNQKFSLKEIWKFKRPLIKILLSPQKILNYVSVKLSYLKKQTVLKGKPFVLMVEASSHCDMNCPMCPVIMEGTKREKGNMAFDCFKRLMDEIGNKTLAICFWNFGEPLLNKDIFKMVSEAKKKNIFTAISTNLLSLNSCHKHQDLFDSGLDYLIVSFDGATEGTYEKFRGKGNFLIVLNNLKDILALKRKTKRYLPFVNLQFVVMKNNEHEIELIKKISRDLGVDKLSLKKFTYIGNNVEDFLPQNKDYILGKHKGIAYIDKCSRPWESAVISWNGDIVPCCGDLKFNFTFGNAFQEGNFSRIWNSKHYTAFRKRILEDINSINMCKTCPSTDFTIDMFVQ